MHEQLRWRLAGAMLPGGGLTCMKIWALGEEFSTMRFTILMRVSLSLICSGGRNGRFNSHPHGALAPSPAWAHFPGTGKGSSSWGLRLPLLDLTRRSPLVSSVPGPALKVPRGEATEGGAGAVVPLLPGPEETPLPSDTSPGVPERCGSHSHRPRSTPCPGSLSSRHFGQRLHRQMGKPISPHSN